MIRYMDYDPRRHKGMPIYAIEDGTPNKETGAIPTRLREVTDPEERKSAEQVPFYYVVKIEFPDDVPPTAQTFKQAPKAESAKPAQQELGL